MFRWLHASLAAALLVGCSLDWDALDPRVASGAGGTAGAGGLGGSGADPATVGGSGGMGGQPSGGGGTASGVGGGGGEDPTTFLDPFDRPDGTIGNGWIEKTSDVFSIEGERVVKVTTSTTSYRDNLVYRPASEDLLDVEIRTTFETLSSSVAFPQIFVRGQSATIAEANEYDGYLFYVAGSSTEAVLGRQIGTPFVVTLESLTIDPPLTVGAIYRLRLSAEGSDPVHLEAYVEQLQAGTWTVIGAATHDDGAPERIDTPGTVGFSGNEPSTFVYDDFERLAL